MNKYWAPLLVGIGCAATSLIILPGEGMYKGFPVPSWGLWIIFGVGCLWALLGLVGLLFGKRTYKDAGYTDEDVQQAKADLERMYLRDHGELPHYPEKEKEKTKDQQDL